MIISIILFIAGFILIIKGGDLFVDSSINIAKASGLPEILIGATIVSIATTLPEVTVSSTAALKGYTTMSLGNAVGSIICNTGFILGIVNFIAPSKINGKVFIVKSFIMILYTGIVLILASDGWIGKIDAFILLGLLFFYIILEYIMLNYNKKYMQKNIEYKMDRKEKIKVGIFFIIGIATIIIGAHLLINNGVVIATYLGIPQAIISLTLIALGTSLPELVAALTALKKGHTNLSIGNIIGANILNIVMVIGVSALINPITILKQNIFLDFPVAILLMTILIIPTLKIKRVCKLQGAFLLITYFGYLFLLYKIYL